VATRSRVTDRGRLGAGIGPARIPAWFTSQHGTVIPSHEVQGRFAALQHETILPTSNANASAIARRSLVDIRARDGHIHGRNACAEGLPAHTRCVELAMRNKRCARGECAA